jgi:glyoxylase-like metal-dependent hydrolase (beta-lactamase superfamily II)
MTAAADYDLIPLAEPAGASLACWRAYDPESKVELHSTALQIGDRLIFIDPIPLEQTALERLLQPATPAGIILTNANHARAAEKYRQRFAVPVYAHEGAVAELGLPVDHVIAGSDSLVLGALEALPLAGAVAGEIALFFAGGGGAMIVGDALIDLPGYGFSILPPKYCANPRQLRHALRALLAKPFAVMTLAHGEPMVTQAHTRLATLLAGEAA